MGDQRTADVNSAHDVLWKDTGAGVALAVSLVGNAAAPLIGSTKDGGPQQTVTRTLTTALDGSTAFDITTNPGTGLKVVAMDIILSVDTACFVTIQMETSGNVLAAGYCPANCGFQQLTPRGYLKGDAAAKKLQAKTSVASKVAVTVIWFTEA